MYHTAVKKFESKFENGICKTTNLRYDENYFLANQINVVTNARLDIRGFDCSGRYPKNNFSIYDENGFKQDGTYMETGEKYHDGYNAFGVDENGKTREGKMHKDIKVALEYMEAIFNPTSEMNMQKYITMYMRANRVYTREHTIRTLKKTVFAAGEMYPKIKEVQQEKLKKAKEVLQEKSKESLLATLLGTQTEEEIKNTEVEIKALKDGISAISIEER